MRVRYVPSLAVILICGSAFAAQLPRYGMFVYSNLCFEKESGDAKGYRLTLLRYGDGDHIVFEWSEGPLYEAAGYKVHIDERAGQIAFGVDVPGTHSPEFSQS